MIGWVLVLSDHALNHESYIQGYNQEGGCQMVSYFL